MNINELINEKVVHNLFGEGEIDSIDSDYIDVSFKNGKKSKFSYPSCFDKFLRFSNKERQNEIESIVNSWKEDNGIFEKEMIRQKTIKTQEEIKQREEERELRRIQRAKELAERNKMFVNM